MDKQTIKVPPKFKRLTEKDKERLRLIQRAKRGSPSAIKNLEKLGARVWTHEELNALNYYLSVKGKLTHNGRVSYDVKIPLRRLTYSLTDMQQANVLWVKSIGGDYCLLHAEFSDGVKVLWVCSLSPLTKRFTLLCDVTEWSEFKVQ